LRPSSILVTSIAILFEVGFPSGRHHRCFLCKNIEIWQWACASYVPGNDTENKIIAASTSSEWIECYASNAECAGSVFLCD